MSPDIHTRNPIVGVTPSYDDGWFNGNPNQQIEFGSYKRFRSQLKGVTEEQLIEFDKKDKEVNGTDARTIVERKREAKAKKVASKKKAAPAKAVTKVAKLAAPKKVETKKEEVK